MKSSFRILIFFTILIFTSLCRKDENNIIKDKDGNIYHSITVGNQEWLLENLKTTKFSDGRSIPLVPGFTAWMRLTTPGYCWYDNNKDLYKEPYGALYNWHAVNTGKLCPQGWHVPDEGEWTELIEYLGGTVKAGSKLKEEGTFHWDAPNPGATNESGFTALAGGARGVDGSFILSGRLCAFWSATGYGSWSAKSFNLNNTDGEVRNIAYGVTNGMSVRCIKD